MKAFFFSASSQTTAPGREQITPSNILSFPPIRFLQEALRLFTLFSCDPACSSSRCMSAQPAPKRRRLTGPDDETPGDVARPLTLIHRRPEELLRSLQHLHQGLEEYGDVVICAKADNGSEVEFAAVSALVAAASRPLGAMLYGPMRACVPQSGENRPRLQLQVAQASHFCHLLAYIHGDHLRLEIEEALEMHHVADFYEVLGLRDECCRRLLEALRPHNCCHLLARGHEVHCEALVQRCLDVLTLEFIAVVEHDALFHRLDPSALVELCSRDELVVAEEFEVFEAIVSWYERGKTASKYEALPELLRLVRWPLVREERRGDALRIAAGLTPPSLSDRAEEIDDHEALARHSRKRPLERASPASSQAGPSHVPGASVEDSQDEQEAGRGATPSCVEGDDAGAASSFEAGAPAVRTAQEPSAEMVQLVSSLFRPSSGLGEGTEPPRERLYRWGLLTARNAISGEIERTHQLVATKEYMIGRSRRSDIRIGHQAPMPYISSQHCRIYHAIRWQEPPGQPVTDAALAPRAAVLQAYLEDLSQNGTFINGQPVGKNKTQALMQGDRIEMVFTSGRQTQQQQQNHFPIFTFETLKPLEPTRFSSGVDAVDAGSDHGDPAYEPPLPA